jgi:hypothetical protein
MPWLNVLMLGFWTLMLAMVSFRDFIFPPEFLTPDRDQNLMLVRYLAVAMIAWNGIRVYWAYTVYKHHLLRQRMYEVHTGPLAEKDVVAHPVVVAPEFQFDETSPKVPDSKEIETPR